MTTIRNHPLLIRANLALFAGDSIEAQRLLHEYYQQHRDKRDDPLVLWLDAQTRANREERIQLLRALTQTVAPDNPYGQLARDTLAEEDAYTNRLQPPPRSFLGWRVLGLPVWILLIFMIAGGTVTFIFLSAFNVTDNLPAQTTALAANAQPPATRTPLPDMSTPVNVDDYALRYEGGIVQVAAIEDNSTRIVSGTGEKVEPVPGARFYALKLQFECRIAICNQPPEARIAIRLDDNTILPPHLNAFPDGATGMQAIALGRTTTGWVVFEIPVSSIVTYLDVRPTNLQPQDPSLVILLETNF
jgi:hypothetical protein